jgi:putative PIN family toxin of toxin-antitoxin system
VRAVIDTNVLLSGLLWHGTPHALLESVRAGTLILISSPTLLAELEEVIGRAKFDAVLTRSSTSREHVLSELRKLVKVIEPPPLAVPMCRDPDDDAVLALALASQAEVIISGDDDLLALKFFQGIPIVDPVKALQLIAR